VSKAAEVVMAEFIAKLMDEQWKGAQES